MLLSSMLLKRVRVLHTDNSNKSDNKKKPYQSRFTFLNVTMNLKFEAFSDHNEAYYVFVLEYIVDVRTDILYA